MLIKGEKMKTLFFCFFVLLFVPNALGCNGCCGYTPPAGITNPVSGNLDMANFHITDAGLIRINDGIDPPYALFPDFGALFLRRESAGDAVFSFVSSANDFTQSTLLDVNGGNVGGPNLLRLGYDSVSSIYRIFGLDVSAANPRALHIGNTENIDMIALNTDETIDVGANGVSIQSQASATSMDVEVSSADTDGTDVTSFTVNALGKDGDANREYLRFQWNPFGLFQIQSLASGTGLTRTVQVSGDALVLDATASGPGDGRILLRPQGQTADGETLQVDHASGRPRIGSTDDWSLNRGGSEHIQLRSGHVRTTQPWEFDHETGFTPSSGFTAFYPKSDDRFYQQTSAAVEEQIAITSETLLVDGSNKVNADLAFTSNGQGPILVAPDAGCWRITVDNAGALGTTSVTCP